MGKSTYPRKILLYDILSVFAYYCVFYFTLFRPSNSDFGYIEEKESTSGYTFTPMWDLLLALAPHSETRNLGFTSHSKAEAIEVK
jgi:hypothetical protein